ncbi:hypothetical protein [Paenibacillus agricola]|uniref:Uncharacterized protein n=1 Tax=Paenibacillus agricola TaxID=2716264 RepID=A0ABX0JGA8_9BACL|nr:hypothetical protein [Paenibacillus agricola]NHN32715.1 hypothetical protein [Paenibacillus agricola]
MTTPVEAYVALASDRGSTPLVSIAENPVRDFRTVMVDIGGWLDYYSVNVFLKHLFLVLITSGQEQVLLVVYGTSNLQGMG